MMSRRFVHRGIVRLWLSVGIPSVFCCIRDPFDQFNIYCLSNIIHPATPSPDDTCNFYLHTACRNTFFTTAICQWPTCCSNYRIMAARPSVNNFWFDPVGIKLIITPLFGILLRIIFYNYLAELFISLSRMVVEIKRTMNLEKRIGT